MDISGSVDKALEVLATYGPRILGALAILVVGYIIAKLIKIASKALFKKIGINRLMPKSQEGAETGGLDLESGISTGLFWLVMLFVIAAIFQTLGLQIVAAPITSLLDQLFTYLPRLIGPAVLLLVAWIVAVTLRIIVREVVGRLKPSRLGMEDTAAEGDTSFSLGDSLGDAVFWLVFLLFLPAILGGLDLGGILTPVQALVTKLLAFVPNLFAAGVIIFIGWFVAGIVRKTVSSLLSAAGVDSLTERLGVSASLGKGGLSGLVGLVIYVLILIPVLVAGLDALQLAAVTQPVSAMLNAILAALPNIFAAAILLGLTFIVGRIVVGLLVQLIGAAGFDRLPESFGLKMAPGQSASAVAGHVIMVVIIALAAIEAAKLLGFEILGNLVSELLVFASHIGLGLVVIGVGILLANFASNAIRATASPQAPLLSIVARVAILLLAGAIGLRQMEIGDEIVSLAFALLLGAMAVAAALAFGIGGREQAGKLLEAWVAKIK